MTLDLRAIEAALLGEPHEPYNLSPEAASVVLPLVRRVVGERDELRAALEEARLTLAAEQGRAEGAPSSRWRSCGRGVFEAFENGIRVASVWRFPESDGWGWWVCGGMAGDAPVARAAMLAADRALFESRRAHCLAKARQLQSDGVILYPPSGRHQQTPAIMIDRLSDPDLSEAVLAIYEKVLFP